MAKRYSRPGRSLRRNRRKKEKMSSGFNPPQASNGPRQQSPDEVRGAQTTAQLHPSVTPGGVVKAADKGKPPWRDLAAAPDAPATVKRGGVKEAAGKGPPWWVGAAAAPSAPAKPTTPSSTAQGERNRRVKDKSFWDRYKTNFAAGVGAATGTSPRPGGPRGFGKRTLKDFEPGMTRLRGPVREAAAKYKKYAEPGVEVVKEGVGEAAKRLRRTKPVRRRYEQTGR